MLISSILSEFYKSYNTHRDYAYPPSHELHQLAKRAEPHSTFFIVAACLIPVLVLLSGIFAGLTLGYMSLDETQLNVLATSGTPKQREYATKIIPVRRNGHLLLVSLLLCNMVVNETLPVISDEVLGGGISAVAVSTVLIVVFAEIIPQSICTRYGLYIGAKCAMAVRILMYFTAIVAWPVAKLLEFILGPHHGIIYRRAELKELINMHSSISPHGGDLKHDTVTIIGHTLDLQEKVVKDAMTPIEKVFMLPIDTRLDYETLRKVCEAGHSRVPVYEEIEVEVGATKRVKKIVGILLVKQCVLLDPKEATPLRSIPLNKVPSVPFDEPLLGILDRFQEGRSHMAIVSLFSKGRAASVKDAVKTGLTRRFLNRVGLGEDDEEREKDLERAWGDLREGKIGDVNEEDDTDVEREKDKEREKGAPVAEKESGALAVEKERVRRFTAGIEGREQAMPADAVLASEDADKFLRGLDTDINPLGIITLEDVLEELIGEEILDEFDLTGPQAASSYIPPSAKRAAEEQYRRTHSGTVSVPVPALPMPAPAATRTASGLPTLQFPKVASSLNIFSRSRSQPGTPRIDTNALPASAEAYKEPASANDAEGVVFVGDENRRQGSDNEGTDASTLGATLTSETGTTAGNNSQGRSEAAQQLAPRAPDILVSDEHGHAASAPSTPFLPGRSPSPAPRVTEAILQTQTRRRAQLQQQAQAHSASSLALPAVSLASGGELQLPVPRQVPKGRFKSSPLSPIMSATRPGEKDKDKDKDADAEDKGDMKDKVPESDPNLDEPKAGL